MHPRAVARNGGIHSSGVALHGADICGECGRSGPNTCPDASRCAIAKCRDWAATLMARRFDTDHTTVRGIKGISASKGGFLARRRARQHRGDAGRSYTFELAALHLQLLIAMAAVDEQVRSAEVDELTSFIDRTTLPPEELERLETVVRGSLLEPPHLETLLGDLAKLAKRPAHATALVNDLARVAAADARADTREVLLLEAVCKALHVDPVPVIHVPEVEPLGPVGSRPATPAKRPERIVTSNRVRSAVRSALEASYERSSHSI